MHGHVVVVMPAFNEAEGIGGFLEEIVASLTPLTRKLSLRIVDDRSTDATADAVRAVASAADIRVVTADVNRGHGPTALAAYREGLALTPDVVLHVDGDGQFVGADLAAVLAAIDDADVVHGDRRGRDDPWFRKVLTALVGAAVSGLARHRVGDANTPLRAYRPEPLARLVDSVPADALVPHVHFSIAERRWGLAVAEVPVRSIPRRGSVATGTMWGPAVRPALPSRRLLSFARRAAGELWRIDVRARP
jgi:dolichol-phosphate mannosyltransferase